METFENYKQKLQARIEGWEAEMAGMKARLKEATADKKIEYQKELDKLEKEMDKGKARLKELQKTGGEAWLVLKKGVDEAWDIFAKSIKDASSKF